LRRERYVLVAEFSPDGRRIATGSYTGGGLLWTLEPDRHSVDELERLAQVLSGTRVDAGGAAVALRTEEFRAAYEDLRRRDPEVFASSRDQVAAWHHQQVLLCEAAHQPGAAVAHLDALVAAGQPASFLTRERARLLAEAERWPEAAEAFAAIVAATPQDLQEGYSLALLRLGAGDRDGHRAACTALLDRFGRDEPSHPDASFPLWACALSAGAALDWTALIARASQVRSAQPQNPMIVSALGSLLYRAGRFDEAVATLAEADSLPEDARTSPIYVWFFLAMTRHRLGHAEESKRWADRALAATETLLANRDEDTRTSNPWRRRLTVQLLRRELDAVRQEAVPEPMPHLELAKVLRKKGLREAAAAEFREAIRLAPDDAAAHFEFGVFYHDTRDGRDAELAEFREAARLDSQGTPWARAELVWILTMSDVPGMRNPAEALDHARKAIEITEGQHPHFQAILALAAYRSGLHDEALAALERAKALGGSEDATAWFLRAMIHWQKGEKEEARPWFDKAVAWMKAQRYQGMYLCLLWTEAAGLLGQPGPDAR
jgi:tetratricopeptide (TPR) repeat protein